MSEKNSNKGFIKGIAVAFLVPLSFYIVTKALSKDKIHMPKHYWVDSIGRKMRKGKEVDDSICHKVADLNLINQLGDHISLNGTLKGKILVVNFFFTTCPIICPKLTGDVSMLQRAFRKNPKMESNLDTAIQFISITVDPGRDTFQALRAYADRYNANHDHWWFLTGDKKAIYNYARNELHLEVGPGDGGAEDFIHTEKIVLLDANRGVRGYYSGLDTAEIRKCADDIVLLTLEK